MSELAGKPLRYLIALEHGPREENAIVEVGYDATQQSGIVTCKYCNLRDEKNTGRYDPYLPADDIDEEYSEPAPDPSGLGFWRNLEQQLERAVSQGFNYVELDNLDTYDVAVARRCFDKVAEHALKVFVKNPLLVEGQQVELLTHAAAVLVIVERSCGLPSTMQRLREEAGLPQMPVRFVAYGDGLGWAQGCATQIEQRQYVDMGVSYSALGEYGSSADLFVPIPPNPPDQVRPTVSIATMGDVLVIVNGRPVT
jgi:hypothetical protein